MQIKKIGFIGLGLIGGSLVKTIRRVHPEIEMIAVSGRESTIVAAYDQGLITNCRNLELDSFCDCQYVFLCTPVQQNQRYLEQLKKVLNKDTIITDVGSVKGDIHSTIHSLGLESVFIGGHPMAGSEKTGLENATSYLFENAFYILTPGLGTSDLRVKEFFQFISSLGAIPIILDYKAHDHATAAISHVPHIIASALVNLVRKTDDDRETMKMIAAGGFKDITRIASSSPIMWEEICISNKDAILGTILSFQEELAEIVKTIQESKESAVLDFFQNAKDYRDSLSISSTIQTRTIFEFYCDLIDEAGGIAAIATILASNRLSIKNIGIIHNREFEDGVLKIEMYDKESYHKSIEILRKYHYVIYER
ncbi:MAG: prephenate dehydrogenase/arogenate dehydrogenase family protein [Lachnospiraceae bacterium]